MYNHRYVEYKTVLPVCFETEGINTTCGTESRRVWGGWRCKQDVTPSPALASTPPPPLPSSGPPLCSHSSYLSTPPLVHLDNCPLDIYLSLSGTCSNGFKSMCFQCCGLAKALSVLWAEKGELANGGNCWMFKHHQHMSYFQVWGSEFKNSIVVIWN